MYAKKTNRMIAKISYLCMDSEHKIPDKLTNWNLDLDYN